MGTLILLIAAVVIMGFLWSVGTENKVRKILVKIEESESDIEVALVRRFDTLTKMRDVCKQYLAHEHQTLVDVVAIRKGMSLQEIKDANHSLDMLQDKINLVSEAYPDLQSNLQYQQLHKAIWEIELQLQAARRIYNGNVSLYNQMCVMFPSRLLVNRLGLAEREFFEADEKRKLQDVNMNI